MESDGYVRSSGIFAGETCHWIGFESHPPHCEPQVKKRSHLRLWRFLGNSRHRAGFQAASDMAWSRRDSQMRRIRRDTCIWDMPSSSPMPLWSISRKNLR